MTLPTPEQLDAETDRQYLLHNSASASGGEPAERLRGHDDAGWRELREHVLSDWTAAVFNAFFPTAGDLAADDTVLIDYWNDIRQQIAGGPGRWSWDAPPNDPAL